MADSGALPLVAVVDDDPIQRRVVESLLSDVARVVTGVNTLDAERLMRQEKPALVLMDDIMPGGPSGLAFLEKIKDDPALSKIPVLMVTASDKPEEVTRGLAAGAVDYLAKPVKAEVLKAAVLSVLSRKPPCVFLSLQDSGVREPLIARLEALGCVVGCGVGGEAFAPDVIVCDDPSSSPLLAQRWPQARVVDVAGDTDRQSLLRVIGCNLASLRQHR